MLGAGVPEVGYEPEGAGGQAGWQIEAAWPDAKVAVLNDQDPARDQWLVEQGWDARQVNQWTADTLSAAIREHR